MTEDVRVKLNPGLPWQSCIQQEEGSFYQQIGLKFEEETSKMLHLEHGVTWDFFRYTFVMPKFQDNYPQ